MNTGDSGNSGADRADVSRAATPVDGMAPCVDSAAFAKARGSLEGEVEVARLERLCDAGVAPVGELQWSVAARSASDELGRRRDFLDLVLSFAPVMACARCLEAVELSPIRAERSFRFAPTERQAEIEDRDEPDIDVLAHDPAFDLAALVEDEAILALPMMVTHDRCPSGSLAQ